MRRNSLRWTLLRFFINIQICLTCLAEKTCVIASGGGLCRSRLWRSLLASPFFGFLLLGSIQTLNRVLPSRQTRSVGGNRGVLGF